MHINIDANTFIQFSNKQACINVYKNIFAGTDLKPHYELSESFDSSESWYRSPYANANFSNDDFIAISYFWLEEEVLKNNGV